MNVKVFIGKNAMFFKDAEYIRKKVFVEEQGVPYENEMGYEDETATHIVIYHLNNPVAVGRIVEDYNGDFKIGRIAVIKEFRKEGYGKELMNTIISLCNREKDKKIKLNSQLNAVNFYKKLGFKECGEVFLEEKIKHIAMVFEGKI